MIKSKARELELKVLLGDEYPDFAVVTKVELDEYNDSLHLHSYKVYYSSPNFQKIRLLMLLNKSLLVSSNPTVLVTSSQDIWRAV